MIHQVFKSYYDAPSSYVLPHLNYLKHVKK